MKGILSKHASAIGIGATLSGLAALAFVLHSGPGTPGPSSDERTQGARENVDRRAADPASLVVALRSTYEAPRTKVPANPGEAKDMKEQLVRAGEGAVPTLRSRIYSLSEPPSFRMDLIALLGRIRAPSSEALLIQLVGDPSLEERYRTVALAQLSGRPPEAVYPVLQRVFETETFYGGRHLILKAIGGCGHPDATRVLLQAFRTEASASIRIQAAEGLGTRWKEPGVVDALRDQILRDPDEQVRLASIAALGGSDDPSADTFLQRIVDQPEGSPSLRAAARNWLKTRAAR